MMNRAEIRAEIVENWQQFEDAKYPEDLLSEFVDSALPIYTNDIIEAWRTDMPFEWTDTGAELASPESTITERMSFDLYMWVSHLYAEIYACELAKREGEDCECVDCAYARIVGGN